MVALKLKSRRPNSANKLTDGIRRALAFNHDAHPLAPLLRLSRVRPVFPSSDAPEKRKLLWSLKGTLPLRSSFLWLFLSHTWHPCNSTPILLAIYVVPVLPFFIRAFHFPNFPTSSFFDSQVSRPVLIALRVPELCLPEIQFCKYHY